ncbi:nucleoside-diphosphate sugar epimerase/dehydratase [Turicibacter sanguinis]|uniref:polysaccharide biosynthesis protein n=1 Tax=Turicibacter sanguinis TaxID=154288 RepID=UPI00232F1467|nr:nucleoside-diphosphate sugar epimerase/dehydratase [Turicibacter sanguinis]MDB8542320.1 nucleoside-diphosphate sugar epimerase/dehydratase [Turicibacter sanguinis]
MRELVLEGPILKKRQNKKLILMTTDIILISMSFILAIIFRYYIEGTSFFETLMLIEIFAVQILLSVLIMIICQWFMKQYQSVWTVAGFEDFTLGALSLMCGTMINLLISMLLPDRLPYLVTMLAGLLSIMLCNGIRLQWRIMRRAIIFKGHHLAGNPDRVLIYGAGMGGAMVSKEYRQHPNLNKKVIGFIDDDKEKMGTYVGTVPVLGMLHDLVELVEKHEINEVVVAIANLDQDVLSYVFKAMNPIGVVVKVMPGFFEMIDGRLNIGMMKEVSVEDLLARDSIKLDHDGISDYLENQIVMVTGGGGSIGSELCRQIVKFNPKQLIIVDIYENNAYDLQNELMYNYPGINLVTLIASVRDRNRINQIYQTYHPQVVFHAAAHKHVPLMEVSPAEAIKNNVVGTLNCAELAHEHGVKRFVLISTDKAVNPTNVMGATKRLCEMVIQSLNPESATEFVAVRFGNVLGSNGSVVPLFKKQIAKGGPVTLTHKDITRYFMTIPEAAQLVLQAGGFAQGGEIFVLDMGKPVKIYDLAENLIKLSGYEPHIDIQIEVTGLRPGEKLYEELLMDEEGLQQTRNEKIFIGQPGEFELTTLKFKIQELLDIANTRGVDELKQKLKEVVPTYEEPSHHRAN